MFLKQIVPCNLLNRASASFLPKSEYSLITGFSNEVSLFSILNGEELLHYAGAKISKFPIHCCLATVGNDSYVVSGSETNEVFVWSLKSGELLEKIGFKDDDSFICDVDYNEASNCLACCGPNKSCRSYVTSLAKVNNK